ncbi:hypothetical protein GCM10009841_36070 [Microlunatus panaciterrae]|uniref:Cupredoxin-like copper-binding protein n=1 Tax=Microlunatus panaciterrae TaxID=400768 RepID=A0ABS2RI70_9ACTN|nr:cupredoxin domain-containing protein [Microlunatus panaciterrae]MBM7798267.1 putative cupredoxin-like copper-binding protein [Microlunatus panaciterrae]
MNLLRPLSAVAGLALLGSLYACGNDTTTAAGGTTYEVKAGDSSCEVSQTSIPAGPTTFEVQNVGSNVTEVYVYGKDGDEFTKIMGEKENIGPGTSQSFDVNLTAGEYEVACKPGMAGDGIRTKVTVTGAGGSSSQAKESYDRELEFKVGKDGRAVPPTDLKATAGEKIEFKLENEAATEFYLRLLDADGKQVGEAEAAAGADAEFIAELADEGSYQVKVFADGKESAAETFTVVVGS